ncbi:hypothetical protein [Streptomyces yerevanensis]|uniref:hypothetical protein n=1 Tax=Streptomyces yerevanensis TaxID=66378 RepID=UPI0006920E11|nr:hypothetical protein [Streptomyces yerevanensis]
MTPAEQTAADLATTGASATTHPIEHVRAYLERQGALPAAAVRTLADQARVRVGGLAKYLQRPPTANGVAFGALEDETGMVNLVFAPPVWDHYGRTLIEASAVLIDGHTECSNDAFNVIVHRAEAVPAPAVARRHRR